MEYCIWNICDSYFIRNTGDNISNSKGKELTILDRKYSIFKYLFISNIWINPAHKVGFFFLCISES
nr:MAG TPA: hypothetical protein [Bacteriophage sp.]